MKLVDVVGGGGSIQKDVLGVVACIFELFIFPIIICNILLEQLSLFYS